MDIEDILGADETGINVIPRPTRTRAPKGSKQVPGLVKKALAQITKVTAISFMGVLLAYQLIFGGKTSAVFPDEVVPAPGSFYSATPSHFANAATTLEFVKKIIVPFIEANRQRRIDVGLSTKEREDKRWAVLIWDNFSAHKDAAVEVYLASHRIKSFFLPPNCTSLYQALDVLFNGNEKQVLKNHFSEWHFQALTRALAENPNVIDVLPKSAAKKRALIAALIRGVHEIMEKKVDLICRAWAKTKLFNDVPEAPANDNIGMDNQLVEEMLKLTLGKLDEVEKMDIDEDTVVPVEEALDAVAHNQVHDLEDEEYELTDQPAVNNADVDDESDDDLYGSGTKRIMTEMAASEISDAASDSAESSHRANFERAPGGGAIKVTFTGKARPSSAVLLTLLKEQRMV